MCVRAGADTDGWRGGGAGAVGPAGAPGPAGAAGKPGIRGYEVVQNGSSFSTHPATGADCPAGKKVIGGGYNTEVSCACTGTKPTHASAAHPSLRMPSELPPLDPEEFARILEKLDPVLSTGAAIIVGGQALVAYSGAFGVDGGHDTTRDLDLLGSRNSCAGRHNADTPPARAPCYLRLMATVARDIHLTLAPEYAELLVQMAQAEQATVEAVAGRLLRFSLDQTRFKPGEVAELLDSIPGFYERYQESLAQARAGRTRGAPHT